VDVETTAALVAEIKRLIDVVGGMALAKPTPAEYAMGYAEGFNDACKPNYTAPPQRPWVGLTYEDMVKLQKDLYDAKGESVLPTTFAMAVEAKLKEKNT
jgi:hypothetical protein